MFASWFIRRPVFLTLLIPLLFAGCTKARRPTPSSEEMAIEMEERSGLGTHELTFDQRVLWNDDQATEILFRYNAGPECRKQACDIALNVALKAGPKTLGKFHDDGQAGDTASNDGVYAVKLNINPADFSNARIRFTAVHKSTLSNEMVLTIAPRIRKGDVDTVLAQSRKYQEEFDAAVAASPDKVVELAKKMESDPHVKEVTVSKQQDAIYYENAHGILVRLGSKPAPDMKGTFKGSGGGSYGNGAAKKSCGGWDGEVLVLAPFHHQFGNDDVMAATKLLQDDPQKRFHVQLLQADSPGGASLNWYENIFERRHGILISTHGMHDWVESKSKMSQRLGGSDLDGMHLYYLMLTNAYITPLRDSDTDLRKLILPGMLIDSEGQIHLTPNYFRNQPGNMRRNSFAYLSFCFSGMHDDFVNAFHARGARVVISFSDIVKNDGWSHKNGENLAKTILEGKKLAEIPNQGSDTFTSTNPDKTSRVITVSMKVSTKKDDDDVAKAVAFPGGDAKRPPDFGVRVDGKDLLLRSYGCYSHKAAIEALGTNWICKWTRTGEKDSTPAVTMIFMGKKAPKVGKQKPLDVMILYGEDDCQGFDSNFYPEKIKVNIESWSESKGMRVTFDAMLSNNEPMGFGDAFKMHKLTAGAANAPIVDFDE